MNERNRLKEIRIKKGLTLAKFGEKVGLTPGAISDMERGRRGITEQTRNSICREFFINKEWLVYGTGEMFIPDSDNAIQSLAAQYGLSKEIQIFIDKLVKSDDSIQTAVINLILDTASAINNTSISKPFSHKSFEEMSGIE